MTFKIETIKLHSQKNIDIYNWGSINIVKDMVKSWGGFRQIGAGCYGVVYGSKNSDIVYKVGDADDNAGYLAYITALSKRKTHNKFTPRIHGVRIYKSKYDSCFIVAMEKLQKLPARHKKEIYNFDNIYAEMKYPNITTAIFNVAVKIPKQLRDAIDLIIKCEKTTHYVDVDFHAGNFMMRGDQIVIIDPLA